ncbi:MAG: hypothetical protein LBC74_12560 [Planctomycetaceae bacterium]|jgi:hypothetical protein|nr:hypothetical protein [Planctomycetaceae bacterium]
MLKMIIKWVDSFSDRMNPIVVRDMRKLTKNGLLEIYVLCYFGIAILAAIIIFLNLYPDDIVTTEQINDDTLIITTVCICVVIFMSMMIGIGYIDLTTLTDEMFFVVPLSPRQSLNAYLGMGALLSFFSTSLSLPPLVILLIITNEEFFIIFTPLIGFLFSQSFALTLISFAAQTRSAGAAKPTQIENFLINIVYAIFLCIIGTIWGINCCLVHFIFKIPTISIFSDLGFIIIYIVLPIILLANGITEYKMCLNGFKASYRTNWFAIFRIIFIYTILNINCAIFYDVVVIIYSYIT